MKRGYPGSTQGDNTSGTLRDSKHTSVLAYYTCIYIYIYTHIYIYIFFFFWFCCRRSIFCIHHNLTSVTHHQATHSCATLRTTTRATLMSVKVQETHIYIVQRLSYWARCGGCSCSTWLFSGAPWRALDPWGLH